MHHELGCHNPLYLQVGLAVDDVKELKKQADEQRIRLMVSRRKNSYMLRISDVKSV